MRKARFMNKIFRFLVLTLLFSTLMSVFNSSAVVEDFRRIKNTSLNEKLKMKVDIKQKKDLFSCRYLYNESIFALDESNPDKVFILISVYRGCWSEFVKVVAVPVKIVGAKSKEDIFKVILDSVSENFEIDENFKFPSSRDSKRFTEISYVKNYLGLKNYIDFEKDGCVYYTVPSEKELDNLHMIYESKDGKERKEFVFTKSGIIPIEDTIGWQIQNGWNKFRNFFSFSTKHEEVKNEGYDCDNEKTRLKEKIY